MKTTKSVLCIILLLILTASGEVAAQIAKGVYHFDQEKEGSTVHHELKISDSYFIHSVYEKSPAKFIKTLGGFYAVENNELKVDLEFNSDYEKDSITELAIPYVIFDGNLILNTNNKMIFVRAESNEQELDGPWLFATRGPDEGQKRRGEADSRKTLKFLLDGRFQWIAFDTEGFQFKGTGGGSYTANNGTYAESIAYFSRDNSRVGATLQFDYEVKGDDWHHKGKNSQGEPMYEIWGKRGPM
ncbi:hypothetical protein FK220_014215 [Flavobacteriaceae bacterium TP-CH-4]|uniref:Membrane or secreted protein n=1 Tax=Pelagihabitans pacificus TaxID=2696054 RepID=A0A967B1T3_9FLAO|nr:hypothetical protein [Pelagihabitans pacificus]NHF60506.1 hypothetical protein [Pelagihabitans pacificus]